MSTIIKSSLILAAVTLVASFALSHINKYTAPHIKRQAREKQLTALGLVLPGYTIGDKQSVTVDGKEVVYWIGTKTEDNIEKKGYAFIAVKPGYSGDVESMVGIDEEDRVLGISILKQTETPGLGARCVEVASKLTLWGFLSGRRSDDEEATPWFQEQFKGLSAGSKISIVKLGDWKENMRDELLEKNAISAMTGATVTSTAVVRGIEEGIILLKKAQEEALKKEEQQ